MTRRAGRVGQWVLPVAAIFVTLSAIWAILGILTTFLSPVPGWADAAMKVVQWLCAAVGAGTVAGIAFLLLATLQRQLQADEHSVLDSQLRRQTQLLEQMGQGLLLSDRAKGVAYREAERDALRRAIYEDLAKQDWEAAYHLIDEMQRNFGYRAEADRLRQEADDRRRETIRANLAVETAKFRERLAIRDWSGARAEAEDLMDRYPGEPDMRNLVRELDEAREGYKRRLLSDFRQAIDRSEFDRGVEILKELDQYLTPGEAAGLMETARGAVKGKLHNLGVQFSMAVSEKNWVESITIGQHIVREFPNSRMAEEVRQTLDVLRQRAGHTGTAGA